MHSVIAVWSGSRERTKPVVRLLWVEDRGMNVVMMALIWMIIGALVWVG